MKDTGVDGVVDVVNSPWSQQHQQQQQQQSHDIDVCHDISHYQNGSTGRLADGYNGN